MSRVNTPKIFLKDSTGALNADIFIALVPLFLMACFSFGARVLIQTAVSVAVAVLTQMFCMFLMRRKMQFCYTPIITGMIIAMISPVTIPYWLMALGSFFAVAVAKMPFGGLGRNPFNPAAAGWCFMVLCAPGRMFAYPSYEYSLQIPLRNSAGFVQEPSVTALLQKGTTPNVTFFEVMLGRVTGPMGTVAILLLLVCSFYLFYRGAINWQLPTSYLTVCTVFALIFPRIGPDRLWSVFIELTAGSLLFCAIFMLTDPVTSPKKPVSRVIYGFLAGILTMLFRYYGFFEQGAPFAILVVNAAAPGLDRLVYTLQKEGTGHGKRIENRS